MKVLIAGAFATVVLSLAACATTGDDTADAGAKGASASTTASQSSTTTPDSTTAPSETASPPSESQAPAETTPSDEPK